MREALSAEFKAAVLTYDERPRTKWLTENSVQNTLTVSRLMFTADINAVFDEMEEGNAGALKVRTCCLIIPSTCSFRYTPPTTQKHVATWREI